LVHALLQGRREILSQVSSSISLMYSLIVYSSPHTVQRNATIFQPMRSSTSLLQALHFIKTPKTFHHKGAEAGKKKRRNSLLFGAFSVLSVVNKRLFQDIQLDRQLPELRRRDP
jgi:hypothetical protein